MNICHQPFDNLLLARRFSLIEALQPLDESLKTTEKDVQALKDELGRQDGKMEYLENQSRRNNIRVNGIPEETDETWMMSSVK